MKEELLLQAGLIVIDVANLSYRNYHAATWSREAEADWAVQCGLLRDVANLAERFNCVRFAFCFDHGIPKRADFHQGYKGSTAAETLVQTVVRKQMDKLYTATLPGLYYTNLFRFERYEADDLMAYLCRGVYPEGKTVLVSSDGDLNQLLGDNVIIYNPLAQRVTTAESLYTVYSLTPAEWVPFKAILGDKSDKIEGVPGVGEIGARNAVLNRPGRGMKRFNRLVDEHVNTVIHNRHMMKLPFPELCDLDLFWRLNNSRPDSETWDAYFRARNWRGMVGRCPRHYKGKALST
jgi:5'-3' exonuclease